jgi:hypothetical protein
VLKDHITPQDSATMDNTTNFKEPTPAMGPPPVRSSARSRVQAPEGTDHGSRPQSQARRLEHRSRSVKNRREIDVVVPPLDTPHDFRPEISSNDEGLPETDPGRTAKSSVGRTTVQEVHKIILSGVGFIHS